MIAALRKCCTATTVVFCVTKNALALDVTGKGGEIPHLAVWVAALPSTRLSAALFALRTQRREPGRYPPAHQAVVQALACYPTGASRPHYRATLTCKRAVWVSDVAPPHRMVACQGDHSQRP